MTIASPLVLDGNEVLLRLHEERTVTGSPVHIDWLRFTLNLRHAPVPTVDTLFPPRDETQDWEKSLHQISEEDRRRRAPGRY